MKYYTGRGDNGETDLFRKRTKKNSNAVEAIGDIDELSSIIGLAYSLTSNEKVKETLKNIEKDLYIINSELAGYRKDSLQENLKRIEKEIDEYSLNVKDIHKFVYPNGNTESTIINICRAVCRRAERHTVSVTKNKEILSYMNRLSSLFFVLFRYLNDKEELMS